NAESREGISGERWESWRKMGKLNQGGAWSPVQQTAQARLGVAEVVPYGMHRFRAGFGSLFRGHSGEEFHLNQRDKAGVLLAQAAAACGVPSHRAGRCAQACATPRRPAAATG